MDAKTKNLREAQIIMGIALVLLIIGFVFCASSPDNVFVGINFMILGMVVALIFLPYILRLLKRKED